FAATGWTLYSYSLNTGSFAGGDLLDVKITGALPIGTFVIAYGCDSTGATVTNDALNGVCDSGNKTYTTPFTEAGFVAPEPSSLPLLGLGLVAVGLCWRKMSRVAGAIRS